ncbi:MAG TPA: enoyl-CoA hydratase/isomerase family protein [Candidatus Limnocylindria bacterium]|nr:enoyl-CoA hydratase/isomerase family protein [Candidatus Limnocylindria bacterium]
MIKEGQYTILERRGAVAKITINRPDKRNALSRAAIREMLGVFEELRGDDETAVVLTTGAGDVAYCAGRDLSEFPTEGGANRGTDRRGQPRAYHLAETIRTFPKVTIAVVNGFCLGGGITLLLPHDLAIASDKAQFGLPEIKRGFLPYPIIATMFKTLIPTKFAFEMILTGENWDAERSKAAGLINRVVPHENLQDEAWKWGEEIGRFDKVTLKYCKMAAHSSMEAASVPLAAEIAWLMQEEHALVNPRAYAGTKQFHK